MNSMPTPPTAYDETAKGPGLSGLLEILRRRRVLAVLPFLFVLTAAVSLAVFLPSLWTARSLRDSDRPGRHRGPAAHAEPGDPHAGAPDTDHAPVRSLSQRALHRRPRGSHAQGHPHRSHGPARAARP